MMFVYRFTTNENGRKKAEVFITQTGKWKIVSVKSAESVIAKGNGLIEDAGKENK